MIKDHNPLDLEGNRVRKEEEAKAKALARENEEEDIRWLMANPQGRRLMSRVLSICGVYRSSFTGNSETFFREGMRNVGLIILADVQDFAPNDFVKMLKEHKNGRSTGDTSDTRSK